MEASVWDGGSGASTGACGTLAARVEVGGRGANGFVELWSEWVVLGNENGFAGVEEGIADVLPNSAAPRSSVGVFSCATSDLALSSIVLVGGCRVDLYFLISLRALILPGFRLQAFLLQLNMWSLRSSSGNWDGRSPFNCNSRDMKPLQALHLARLPDGEFGGSNHVCEQFGQLRSGTSKEL